MSATFALPIRLPPAAAEQYIQTVNSVPMLSQEEETELATRLHQHNDLDAARRLVIAPARGGVRRSRLFWLRPATSRPDSRKAISA